LPSSTHALPALPSSDPCPCGPLIDIPPEQAVTADEAATRPATLTTQLINLGAVIVPLAGLAAAIMMLWGVAFNWLYLGLLVGMYVTTGLGITIGYHRLFTHRAFRTSKPVEVTLAVLGSMAVEGPLLKWVATHRRHHQHSDDHGDPHSPHTHGESVIGFFKGLWHAHLGWIFAPEHRGLARYASDLRKDRALRFVSRGFPWWVVLGLAIPAALGGLFTMSWMGVFLGFVWGGLVRVCVLHHVTWSVNSVCHLWGTRPYRTGDESRNNPIVGVLALGEGWHNNHHAFPTSAAHGLRWWQIDVSYLIIRAMGAVGLATEIRRPSEERLAAKSRR
jgi:stearoyl-CoA desaturase (Delta-9 desaturase)